MSRLAVARGVRGVEACFRSRRVDANCGGEWRFEAFGGESRRF